DAIGSVVAKTVHSNVNCPPYTRAMMDGVAVQSSDAGRTVSLLGEIPAGHASELKVEKGQCVTIMTGAACPPGADAVVRQENIVCNQSQITLPNLVEAGMNIDQPGRDCPVDAKVARTGDVVTPLTVAALASVGQVQIEIVRRPIAVVITTGRELASPGESPGLGQIRDSNGPMLQAQAILHGVEHVEQHHAGDTKADLDTVLGSSRSADLILLTGGVSVGKYDLVAQAVEECGGEVVFHGVKQRPGKPVMYATRGDQQIFGLPGNPLAAHLCFHRYVAPAICILSGREPNVPSQAAKLTEPLKIKGGVLEFVPAMTTRNRADWVVTPMRPNSVADVFSTNTANSYIRLPSDSSKELPAGSVVEIEWLTTP
ncbi:MAG: molybdopterin molybdotransferase MoeA, partial [Candidatus Latescibacteria bacterium]|nr:molybdopterin molybdotransferase MoeA [Candidatus Latescibacterota bacterium]